MSLFTYLPCLVVALLPCDYCVLLISLVWASLTDMQCLQIGDQVHKFSNIVPEAHSSPFEVYRHKHSSSSTPKIDLLGRVTHKCQVRRGLDSSSMERIKNRTEEAERERNSRKYLFPPLYLLILLELCFWKNRLQQNELVPSMLATIRQIHVLIFQSSKINPERRDQAFVPSHLLPSYDQPPDPLLPSTSLSAVHLVSLPFPPPDYPPHPLNPPRRHSASASSIFLLLGPRPNKIYKKRLGR
jgi:hypothetical protein